MRWTLALLLAACAAPAPTPTQAPHPMGDAAPQADPCTRMCQHLRDLSCQEGAHANCAAVCQHMHDTGISAVEPECVVAATTVDAVRGCGVRCRP